MIKKYILSILKIGLPLALGLYLVWFFFDTLSPVQKQQIKLAVLEINYWWVVLAIVPAVLSHVSRAIRWKYTLEPLGYTPDSVNSFLSIMIGYLVNLAIPRLGEISRCGYMSRYNDIPMNKLIGTVIAERLADFIMLIIVISTVVLTQYKLISEFLNQILADHFENISSTSILITMGVLIIGSVFVLYMVYKIEWEIRLLKKVQGLMRGVLSGVYSIFTMKNKGLFIAHTFFIWIMYFLMLYFNFFALDETSSISFMAALTAFVFGGLAMIVTNGGIGAYPIAIQTALVIFGYDSSIGGALGWITWLVQTILIITLGVGSMAYISIYNKNKISAVSVDS